MSSTHSKHLEFVKRSNRALKGGGDKAIEKQIAMGKLTARDRINALLDANSFHEYDLFVEHRCRDFDMDKKVLPGDGVITGTGMISGQPVGIYAQDFTVAGGSLGLMHARKITKIMDHAIKMGLPLIGINDSGGARIQEGVDSLAGYGEIFYRNTAASGVIPQISVILGPCAGGAVYSPALTDFVFVVDQISKMFITGPEVIKTVLGEEISMEDLGGARVHTELSGNAHFFAKNEVECFHQIKKLMTFIPWQQLASGPTRTPPRRPSGKYDIEQIIPPDSRQPLRCARRHPGGVRQLGLLRGAAALGREHRHRFRAAQRRDDRRGGKPAAGAGRGARRGLLRQGRPVHPVLRRLQYPARHPCGSPGLPAGRRPGTRRRHPARGEDRSTPTAKPPSRRSP